MNDLNFDPFADELPALLPIDLSGRTDEEVEAMEIEMWEELNNARFEAADVKVR